MPARLEEFLIVTDGNRRSDTDRAVFGVGRCREGGCLLRVLGRRRDHMHRVSRSRQRSIVVCANVCLTEFIHRKSIDEQERHSYHSKSHRKGWVNKVS